MKNKFLLMLSAVVGIALFVAAALPLATNTGLKVGDKAPDFQLKNVDGRMVSMADFKDVKGYIVTFTCNTCPYAVM
ncbi:MAG TPA: redoxin domain-containing protein, partial [Saprospiraceae bacterium]|nr:redoxin domain-containing protein [Saprospiraceae bacterium]